MQSQQKKILIVGAGFGGLSAAALLAKQGHDVTVLEKNGQPGGRARTEQSNGFTFDMGPSWYLMPQVFETFYNQMGTTADEQLDLTRLNPGYSAFFGKEKLHITNPQKTKELFESIEPGAGKKLDEYLKLAQYQYDTAMKEFIYKNYKKLTDFFTIKLLKEAIKLNIFSSLHKHVKKYFKDSRLQKIMEYSMVFLGGSPSNTPALYSLMSHVDITTGVFYPKGGLHQVAVSFEQLAQQHGAEFIYNAGVEHILIQDNTAVGVKYNGKKIFADKIIINTDYAHAQLNLIGKKHRTYSERYWNTRTIAPSAYIMYLGVNKKLPPLDHHNLFLAQNWNNHFDQIFKKPQWPDKPSYYVCNPNKTEPQMAPQDSENLFFLVPVAAGLNDNADNRERMRDKILQDFETRIGTSIQDDIVFERIFAHNDFTKYYNAYKGTALGLSHTMFQTAIFRPKQKDKKIQNLYYTGQYTHPGIGVPMVIISSQILVNEIEKK